jgi:hypothetical protein
MQQKCLFGLALNQSRHILPMAWPQHQRFRIQRPLQQGNAIVVILLGSHSTQVSAPLGRMSTQAVRLILEMSISSCSDAAIVATLAEDASMVGVRTSE